MTTFTTIGEEEVINKASKVLGLVHMGWSAAGGGTGWDRVKIFASNLAAVIARHSSQKFTVKLLNDLDPSDVVDTQVLNNVPKDPHFQNAFQIDNGEQINILMRSKPRNRTPGGRQFTSFWNIMLPKTRFSSCSM
jgi:hypothetical protein